MTFEVYNLNHSITMTTMKCGLQSCPFFFSLKKKPLADFFEMLTRAKKYVHVEKVYETHVPCIASSSLVLAPSLISPSTYTRKEPLLAFSSSPRKENRRKRPRNQSPPCHQRSSLHIRHLRSPDNQASYYCHSSVSELPSTSFALMS